MAARKPSAPTSRTRAKVPAKPAPKHIVIDLPVQTRGRGRPSKFSDINMDIAYRLAQSGHTSLEIADALGVSEPTLYSWGAKHPDFLKAIKVGKEQADERVVRSLYHKAIGYTFEAEEVHVIGGDIVRVRVRKHNAPDTAAAIIWLKNRRPGEWRDKVTVEHTVDDSLRAWMLKAAEAGDAPALEFDEGDIIDGEYRESEPVDRDLDPGDFDITDEGDED